MLDQTEDEFALAPRVTGVDNGRHVFALEQFDHGVQTCLGLVNGCELKVGRHHRQVGKAPFAAFDVVGLGGLDFYQVTHGRGDHPGVVFKVFGEFFKLARHRSQRTHDVLGDAGFFRNDDGLAHRFLWALFRHFSSQAYNSGLARTHTHTHARTRP